MLWMCSGRVVGSLFAEPHTENWTELPRDKGQGVSSTIDTSTLDLGPWTMDRLRRPDNGGGNGVYASRRYVLLDRHAARAGGRAHLSVPFLGNLVSLQLGPCRMIFLTCCLTVFGPCLVQKRRSSCRRAMCPLSMVEPTHPHVQTSLSAKRI